MFRVFSTLFHMISDVFAQRVKNTSMYLFFLIERDIILSNHILWISSCNLQSTFSLTFNTVAAVLVLFLMILWSLYKGFFTVIFWNNCNLYGMLWWLINHYPPLTFYWVAAALEGNFWNYPLYTDLASTRIPPDNTDTPTPYKLSPLPSWWSEECLHFLCGTSWFFHCCIQLQPL